MILQANPLNLKEIKEKVRALLAEKRTAEPITVELEAGQYNPADFRFSKEDCSDTVHVTYRGQAGAVIHGGVAVNKEEWERPDAAMAARFSKEALPHIYKVSFSRYGITKEQWDNETAIGGFGTEGRYDDAHKGCGCELFTGAANAEVPWEKRMTKSRYPNRGSYLKLDAIKDVGDCYEFPPHNYRPEWYNRRNQYGGCYIMDKDTAARTANWKETDGVWMFGYFYWDWADSSTPITLKPEAREIYPKYVSVYGARAGALYYFYNVAEELDEEGEWYLDRKTGDVYFWPWQGADRMDFSCCQEALLTCEETCNMTFEDLSLRCGTVAAIAAVGSNMTFTHLHVSDIRMNAVSIIGENNVISCSELCNLGAGGISLGGGEVNSLTHGNNAAVNNRIHDFGQLTQTAAPGISLAGVGNIAAHNEIYETPHMAIFYAGNEHVIEYNDIHDAVKMSHDAGAIYAGRDMGGYGTVIRYNVLQRIGSTEFRPQGIYWDDAQCGQTAIGNVFIDVGCRAFLIGGGRDHVVKNNLIVRCGEGIQYDDRFREGHLFGGWYGDVHTEMQKKQISDKPRNEEPWISRYPSFAAALSRILCKLKNAVKNRVKYLPAAADLSVAALFAI